VSVIRSYTIKTEVMEEGWEEKIGGGGGRMGGEDRWRRRKDGRRR